MTMPKKACLDTLDVLESSRAETEDAPIFYEADQEDGASRKRIVECAFTDLSVRSGLEEEDYDGQRREVTADDLDGDEEVPDSLLRILERPVEAEEDEEAESGPSDGLATPSVGRSPGRQRYANLKKRLIKKMRMKARRRAAV